MELIKKTRSVKYPSPGKAVTSGYHSTDLSYGKYISHPLANIISKLIISLFIDFYAPLKH